MRRIAVQTRQAASQTGLVLLIETLGAGRDTSPVNSVQQFSRCTLDTHPGIQAPVTPFHTATTSSAHQEHGGGAGERADSAYQGTVLALGAGVGQAGQARRHAGHAGPVLALEEAGGALGQALRLVQVGLFEAGLTGGRR